MKDRQGLEIVVGDTLLDERENTLIVSAISDEGVTGTRFPSGVTFTLRNTEATWVILKRASGSLPPPPRPIPRRRSSSVPEGAWEPPQPRQTPELSPTPKRPWWRFWG